MMALSSEALVTLKQAKNYLRVDAVASLKMDAEYVGVGTAGGEVEFPLPSGKTPISGSLVLRVDNELQVEDTDFTFAADVITFDAEHVPADGDIITASYDYEDPANTFESFDNLELEQLIAAATRKAEDHTGRAFVQREITETHIGDGTKILKLYRRPIVAIEATAITIDGVVLESWSERLSIGRLYHLTAWPQYAEIIVTYTAGYAGGIPATQALVPAAVSAVLLILADLFENRGDKVDSINIAGVGSVSYKLPSRAEELLAPLRTNVL